MVEEDARAGLRPFFACATAGTVNSGSIDPLHAVADVCARHGLWLHVDGAYGGFAALSERTAPALAGMRRADSLTLDPHKWLYSPMGTGCALVRDAAALESAFSTRGEYLRDLPPGDVNFLARGPEMSRPARVLGVWMVIRSAGRRELARQVDADLELAGLAADLLAAEPAFEIVTPPELSVVTFRCRTAPGETEAERAERDRRLVEAALHDGTLLVSSTLLGGRSALRLVVMNHRTTEDDVRRSVAKLRELAG
jgi:glutamate/tyrosine decarboxylase-like PLP-dependent enzyme